MGAADRLELEEVGTGNHNSFHNTTTCCSSTSSTTLIFTYGTLKHGFSNHTLLQDMIAAGDAAFLGLCRTAHQLPLVCGPYRVPFLLNFHGHGHRVSGELYSVSPRALARMNLMLKSLVDLSPTGSKMTFQTNSGRRRKWVRGIKALMAMAERGMKEVVLDRDVKSGGKEQGRI